MKTKLHEKIEKLKREVKDRQKNAVKNERDEPMFAATSPVYEISERTKAMAYGGIGAVHQMVKKLGLVEAIDQSLSLLKIHRPYHESDHVLNIAYNQLCGGRTLDDIELRRNDAVYLDALGADSIPDPTTAGDFCRRFEPEDIQTLMNTVNDCRVKLWQQQPREFLNQTAIIDADGTVVEVTGECKEGMDINHKSQWGYGPLLVSLANTKEPLFIENRGANRPSHEGVVKYFNQAIELVRSAGFASVMLRGDTDFSLTKNFDGWDDDGVQFVFGYDAKKTLKDKANAVDESEYWELVRRVEGVFSKTPRKKPINVKEEIVKQRGFTNIKLVREDLAEFMYRPVACKREYLIVALRKTLSIHKGQQHLFDETRYFFYISNCVDTHSAADIVREANLRCDQENLIEQLKNGVRAFHAPTNTFNANWAYMVMASLAWTLKVWCGLMLPVEKDTAQRDHATRRRLITMDFRTFLTAFITIPCQVVHTGRRLVYRLLGWNPSLPILFRLVDALKE